MAKMNGKLPEPGARTRQILENPDKYFADAREKHRRDILAERDGRKVRRRLA